MNEHYSFCQGSVARMKKVLILIVFFLPLASCAREDQSGIPQEASNQLIFNSVEITSITTSGMWPEGEYSYRPLTDEQLSAVFPGLGSNFFASAHYLSGAFRGCITGGFWDSGIEIALGESRLSFTSYWGDFGFPPPRQRSNMHGVEVTAFLVEEAGTFRPPFLQVDFSMDNMHYRVRLLHDISETAQAHVAEVVERIILGGPADLSVLRGLPAGD